MNPYLTLLRVEFTVPRTVTSRAVRSYHTLSPLPVLQAAIGGLLSVALVVGLRRPDVIWHPALWSPDFPLRNKRSDHPASLTSTFYTLMQVLILEGHLEL